MVKKSLSNSSVLPSSEEKGEYHSNEKLILIAASKNWRKEFANWKLKLLRSKNGSLIPAKVIPPRNRK